MEGPTWKQAMGVLIAIILALPLAAAIAAVAYVYIVRSLLWPSGKTTTAKRLVEPRCDVVSLEARRK